MKTRKLSKKLDLNKKTVANLNRDDMQLVRGGYETEIVEYCDSIICSVIHSFCPDCMTKVRTICD